MLAELQLPEDVERVRVTQDFTAETVPPGLLAAHLVAAEVWGRLVVLDGSVTFVAEESGESRVLAAGDTQAIPSGLLHHVEPGDGARFHVEFHR